MNLAALLAALAWPMVSRVLLAMGLGVVTYTGASLALTTASNAAKAAWSGMTADVLQLLALAGIFQSMSIIVGGIAGGLAFLTFKKIGFTASGT
jgi:hypothetical protein